MTQQEIISIIQSNSIAPLGSWKAPQAATRRSWYAGLNTVSYTNRVAMPMPNGCSTFSMLFTNIYRSATGEDLNFNGMILKMAVEYPAGTITPVYFSGKRVGHMEAGAMLLTDPIGISVAPGGVPYLRIMFQTPMAPSTTATGATTGGVLAAATYYYKVTSVTEAGESNGSVEVSATTTGATSSVTLKIGDKNMSGANVTGYKIYRSTTTGTETLYAAISSQQRDYIDTGLDVQFSTTLNGGVTANKQLTLITTAGLRSGDIITIGGTGYTVFNVFSDTIVHVTSAVTATTGAAVTLGNIAPSNRQYMYNVTLNSTVYASDGFKQGWDMVDADNGYSFSASTVQGTMAPVAILAYPAAEVVNPKPAIGAIGDSIMYGQGWTRTDVDYKGFFGAALLELYPYVQLGSQGESAAQFVQPIYSKHRMSMLQSCKYIVCNYGTNDLSGTLATIKANLVLIAQRCAQLGVKKYWQCTILPRTNASTDGYQTASSQTLVGGIVETNRTAINTWLRAAASAGAGNSFSYDVGSTYLPFIGVFDTAGVIEVNSSNVLTPNGGFWKPFGTATYDTNIGTVSGTTNTLTDSGKAWTVNQWQGYNLASNNAGVIQYTSIVSNTATTVTLVASITVPSGTTTYSIYKSPTYDGTHPTDFGYIVIAGGLDTTLFI